MDLNPASMKSLEQMIINVDSILKFNAQVASESEAILATDILSQIALASSWWQDRATKSWVIEALVESDNLRQLHHFIRVLNEAFQVVLIDADIVDLEQRDWLRENQESFPPLEIGQFYIYGSHIKDPSPGTLFPLLIDAATAFGSGNHGSTRGCLLTLSKLQTSNYTPNSILDVGCGSGILAMAAAKLWPTSKLIASDIDHECVSVTQENCRANNVNQINVLGGDGFQNDTILLNQPFNLIIANILATVLCDIVADIKKALSSGGVVILSGILDTQKDMVAAKYAEHGLILEDYIQVDEWVTLTMKSNDL
jgi:ribosomal protein L11 methyltransferase